MATNTSFAGWDWHTKHVEERLKQGEYVSAETILVAAGPPRFEQVSFTGATAGSGAGKVAPSAAGAGAVYPIGLIENFGLSQNKQLQRLFEIGSKRSYFVPGRNIASFSLGRVLFWGPSLMRVMYAYYPQSKVILANGAKGGQGSNDDGIEIGGDKSSYPEVVNVPGTVMGEDPDGSKA